LHHGSLVAALGSWLDARAQGGKWLLRMEDLDRARNVPGAADAILATLDSLGLTADEPVLWQSARADAHALALDQLRGIDAVYRCTCSRSEEPGVYSGQCRRNPAGPGPAAWRLKLDAAATIAFDDILQGPCSHVVAGLGDPVIFRRDGVAAYQLAVVVDDAFQGITHVVRGADLLESTVWQIAVGRALGLSEPVYAHLPLVVEADGAKLAKSRHAQAIALWAPGRALERGLGLLGYTIPEGLGDEAVPRILDWALSGWPPPGLAGRRTIALPA
jgi:glutamyl-Q tRNA(Asp) synthetase